MKMAALNSCAAVPTTLTAFFIYGLSLLMDPERFWTAIVLLCVSFQFVRSSIVRTIHSFHVGNCSSLLPISFVERDLLSLTIRETKQKFWTTVDFQGERVLFRQLNWSCSRLILVSAVSPIDLAPSREGFENHLITAEQTPRVSGGFDHFPSFFFEYNP